MSRGRTVKRRMEVAAISSAITSAITSTSDIKKLTVAAKGTLRSTTTFHSGSVVSISGLNMVSTLSLGELCWNVCVSQHERRVNGRKEGKKRRRERESVSFLR